MEEKIYEGEIKGAEPSKLLKETNLNYMNKTICKISGNLNGTGFFTKIDYKNETIPVLMTNYHVIDDKFIEKYKQIKIYVNNNEKNIKIKKNSKIYSSPKNKYDIIIIKLNEEDELNNEFLELEQNIFLNNSENNYKEDSIYILHFPKNGEATISYGCGLEKINDYDIKHLCNTDFGSSGGPILNKMNNKLLGIHRGYHQTKNINKYNYGTFLKFPLNDLKKLNEKKDYTDLLSVIFEKREIIEYDYEFNYIITGTSFTTQSEILVDYRYPGCKMNMGIESVNSIIDIENKIYKINLLNKPFFYNDNIEEREYYYKNYYCIIFIYDVTNNENFNIVTEWIREFKYINNNNISFPILIEFNKENSNLDKGLSNEGRKFADNNRINFYKISKGIDLKEIIHEITKEISKIGIEKLMKKEKEFDYFEIVNSKSLNIIEGEEENKKTGCFIF